MAEAKILVIAEAKLYFKRKLSRISAGINALLNACAEYVENWHKFGGHKPFFTDIFKWVGLIFGDKFFSSDIRDAVFTAVPEKICSICVISENISYGFKTLITLIAGVQFYDHPFGRVLIGGRIIFNCKMPLCLNTKLNV